MSKFPETGDWAEYQRLVFFQLETLTDAVNELNKKVEGIKEDLTILKVKASLIGGLAGMVVGIIATIITHFALK